MRRRSQLSCESEFLIRCYVFVRCLTRPPDNLGMPLTFTSQSRNHFAPESGSEERRQNSADSLKIKIVQLDKPMPMRSNTRKISEGFPPASTFRNARVTTLIDT